MKVSDILRVLKEDIKAPVLATVDQQGRPHARYINIGVADERGIFFMTSPKTDFYQQLQANPQVAIAGKYEEEYLIQVIRIQGKVKKIGKERLAEVLKDNPYVAHVYPDSQSQADVQVFHLYEGEGFYQSLTQGHRYTFSIGKP